MSSEKVLSELIVKYLKHRDSLPPLPEEDPSLDWSNLSQEERENRKKQQEEKDTQEKTKKEEEEKEAKAAYDALDELGKINFEWNKKVEVVHKECSERLKLQRLTKEEKKQLFQTIRYSYMTHEELIGLTSNPIFELAKDFIVEGLSAKLNTFENAIKSELKINLEPRTNYDPNNTRMQDEAQVDPMNVQGLQSQQQQHQNPFLRKPMFENYYERKLHDQQKDHGDFASKMVMNQLKMGVKNVASTAKPKA